MMCRLSTTTIGSRVGSITTSGLTSAGTGSAFSLTSTTAVPFLCPVEEQEPPDEHHHGPNERVPPEVPGRVVQVLDVIAVLRQQRVPAQLDVDVPRIDLQHLDHPGVILEAGLQVGDAEDDAGEIEPGAQQERQQLGDVPCERAQPGHYQADPDVEGQLQQDHGNEQQPVHGQRL